MIACIANNLYLVGNLCVLGILRHISVLMACLIYYRTSSTLVASPASRVFTLGTLGVLGRDDDGSVESAMVALVNIS